MRASRVVPQTRQTRAVRQVAYPLFWSIEGAGLDTAARTKAVGQRLFVPKDLVRKASVPRMVLFYALLCVWRSNLLKIAGMINTTKNIWTKHATTEPMPPGTTAFIMSLIV